MKGANESNCQFKFVNKFAKRELAPAANPKQLVLHTITQVMTHQETIVTEYAAATLPIRNRRSPALAGRATQSELAHRQTSFLESQVLQAKAELAKVNRQNQDMQQQLEEHQTKIDQLSQALSECVNSELSQSNHRLREICLPLLSPNPKTTAGVEAARPEFLPEGPIPEAPITVELDDHGKPVYLQSWNPDVITIIKTDSPHSGRVEKFAPETFAQEAAQAALDHSDDIIHQPVSEVLATEPIASPLALRVDLPKFPR
jgi:exonuclease VII large subunit